MSSRLVLLGFVLCLSMPASAQRQSSVDSRQSAVGSRQSTQQTSRGRERVTPSQTAAPRGPERQVPAGRKYWDNPDEAGAWVAWDGKCEPGEQTPTGAAGTLHAQWEKQLKAIAALVRACPVFKDVRGYYPEVSGCVSPPGGIGTGPWGGRVALILWPPVAIERTPAGEPKVRTPWLFNIPDALFITVNRIGDIGFSWFWGEDKEGRFYELPETRREVAGFPVIGEFLSISLPNKPPRFTPITQERAQRWIIDNLKRQASADASILASARRQYEEFVSPAGKARREKEIEDTATTLKKPDDQAAERRRLQTIDQRREHDLEAAATPKIGSPEAHTAERITQLEARLGAMSPEQRRQPAWYKQHPEGVRRLDYGDIVAEGTAGARPLVVPNPGFFDPALPKTAMQLVVTQPDDDRPTTRSVPEAIRRVFHDVIEQMDWRAVAATLK